MSKTKTIFAFFCMLLLFSVIFSACSQKDSRPIIFENDFSKGNNSTFTSFGTIQNNNDKTISLIKSKDNIGPVCYFGKENKNSVWVDRGLTSELVFEIKPSEIETDKCFDWSFVINNLENSPLSQVVVSFRKYKKGLMVGHSQKTGENSNKENTSNENSKVIEKTGDYILQVSFYSNIKDEILFNITLTEKSNNEDIFVVSGEKLLDSDEKQIETSQVGGMRSVGLSYMNIETIKLKKVRLLENW